MLTKTLLDLAKPFLRRSPRFTGKVYGLLGGDRNELNWGQYGRLTTRGTEHGLKMELDVNDWSQRSAYYLGRFYDVASQRVTRKLLREGDTYVDIGANIGMMTLNAAAIVGPSGTVLSFEPNPKAREHLQRHVAINDLKQVRVFGEALSFERGTLKLNLPTESSGRGTLRRIEGETCGSFDVPIALLDDYAEAVPTGRRTLIKIDTEGFDFNVIRGGRKLLERPDTFVIAEVNDAWLREIGQSAEVLFRHMHELGYDPYYPDMCPRLWRQHLVICPVTLPGPHHWFDTLFVRKNNADLLLEKGCR